jgi:hypothetical protein
MNAARQWKSCARVRSLIAVPKTLTDLVALQSRDVRPDDHVRGGIDLMDTELTAHSSITHRAVQRHSIL